jgi:hypothetical protein
MASAIYDLNSAAQAEILSDKLYDINEAFGAHRSAITLSYKARRRSASLRITREVGWALREMFTGGLLRLSRMAVTLP